MRCLLLCIFSSLTTIHGNQQSQSVGQNWLDSALPPNSRTIVDNFFEPEHTYTFLYDAQLTTGIPGASKQHSGTRIQCLAELIFNTPTSCVLQLSHVHVGRLNRKLADPRQIVPTGAFDEVPMHDDVNRTLQMPVGFTYIDGVVGDVTFDGEESPWSSNIIRGVLNMLQVTLKTDGQLPTEDLRLVNLVKVKEDISKSQAKHYRVQEKTLEGECESVYTMFNASTTENIDKLVIIKSIDFANCRMRPEIKYNIRFAHPCPDCRAVGRKGKHEFLKPSTLARYSVRLGRSGGWLLKKANFESEHIFSPYDPQAGVAITYINQTLTLLKSDASTSSARPIHHPVKSDWGLVYALDWDIWKERFYMDGEEDRQLHFLRRMPYSDVKRQKRTLVTALVRALLTSMRTPEGMLDEEAPHYLMRIVQAFRLFTRLDLDELHSELTSPGEGPWNNEERKVIKSIFPHFVAMCSTKECISLLLEKIEDGTIPPNKAASAIKNLMTDRSISEKDIARLLELADNEIVAQNFYLRQSLWLTIGSLMNGLCMANDEILAREYTDDTNTFCTRQLKENYVEMLFNKFNAAEKWADRVLLMKAIGNAGIDLSVFSLEKIIRNLDGQHNANSIRREAILALRQLIKIMPIKIQKILLPLVTNQLESPRVRISAAYQLFQTMPEKAILDQLARMVVCDPSRQVASFVLSYMTSLAESASPCRQKMATDLKLALRHAKEEAERQFGSSAMWHYDTYSQPYIAGVEAEFGSLFLNTSFLPKYLTATFHANAMGFWQKYLLNVGLVQDGVEPLVRDWIMGTAQSADPQPQPKQSKASRLRRTVAAAVKGVQKELNALFTKVIMGTAGSQAGDPQPQSGKSRYRRTVADGVQNEMNALFTKLGIKPRQHPNDTIDPKLYAYMKFMDQDYAMLPFLLTDDQRQSNLADGAIDLQAWKEELRRGVTVNINEANLLAEMSYKIPTAMGVPLVWNLKLPVMLSVSGQVKATSTPESGPWQKMKLEVDLKPSLVALIVMEMEAWSPVVNSGLKVISKVKLNTPIAGQLELDKQSDQVITKLTLKSPPGKREILSLETRPIILSRIWPYRELKKWNEPDIVTIFNEDASRISKFNQCFGKAIFGVDICVRGRYLRTSHLAKDAPQCPLGGLQRILVTAEPASDTPAEISMKLSTKFYEQSADPITSLFSDWVPMPDDDQSNESPPQYRVAKPYNHSIKLEVESNQRPLFNADFTHLYDPNHLYGKLDWKFQTLSAPRLAVCLKSETLFPRPPYTIDDMQDMEKKKVMSSNKLTWGSPQCQDENYALFEMEAHQPQSYKDLHRADLEHLALEGCADARDKTNCSPVVQHEHLARYSDLTMYKVLIEKKNVPTVFTNATGKLYERFKHALYAYSDVNSIDVSNPKDKVFAKLELDPRTKRKGNFMFRSPNENAIFADIPLPENFHLINLKRNRMKTLVGYISGTGNRALCHVSDQKIKTFDGVEYSTPLSTCFHIISQDCSSETPRFVVMIRKLPDGVKKELKVTIPKHRVSLMSTEDNSIAIDVNGSNYTANEEDVQNIQDENGRIFVRIFSMGPYVKLEFPETKLFVYFDGYAVNVKLSRLYLGHQCGLCGHFDNEPLDEFRKPDFTLEKDIRKFYMSWTLKGQPEGCSVPDVGPEKFSATATEEGAQGKVVQPLKKTKVVEINLEICFSVEGVDECPMGSYAVERETRPVQFVCMQRDDELVEWALGKLRMNDVIRIDREATAMRNLDIPTKCATMNAPA